MAIEDGGVSRVETRVFKNGGDTMELIHTIPNKPEIRSFRVYHRIST